jgi:hypothetical protein
MNNVKFYSAFALLFFAALGLSYATLIISIGNPAVGILCLGLLNALGCYLLLGLGLAIPLVLLASIFGWLHLVLLLSGKIDPHLSQEGFFTVLNTLFKKI